MELLLILIASTLGGYLLLNGYRVYKFVRIQKRNHSRSHKSFEEIVQEVFPQKNLIPSSLGNNNVHSENQKRKPNKNYVNNRIENYAKLSILGEAAWYGAESVDNLLSVNENVYDAISQLSGSQMNSISDLNSYLADWKTDWVGNLTDKGLDNLQGHIAEFNVADHLTSLGHEVEFPDASNFPGVDLFVDGHPFNVKDAVDVSSVYEHFQKYPEIGVISNVDMAHLPAGLPHIDPTQGIDQLFSDFSFDTHHHIVDSSLSQVDMLDNADSAADAITGNIDFHFPIITIGLSSFRELNTLMRGDTDLMTSVKNIGLDTAGIGGGGFLGAKAGAAFGTMLFPGIGTAIGAALGGIGGALAGKFITNAIKTEQMDNARAIYMCDIQNIRHSLFEIEGQSRREIKLLTDNEQSRLNELNQKLKEQLVTLQRNIQQSEIRKFALDNKQISLLFDKAIRIAEDELSKLDSKLLNYTFSQKYLWPIKQYILEKALRDIIISELKGLKTSRKSILAATIDQSQKTNIAFEILSIYKQNEEMIKEHLVELKNHSESNKKEYFQSIKKVKIELVDERIRSFKLIDKKIDELRRRADRQLAPLTDKLKRSKESLIVEMKKLGLKSN